MTAAARSWTRVCAWSSARAMFMDSPNWATDSYGLHESHEANLSRRASAGRHARPCDEITALTDRASFHSSATKAASSREIPDLVCTFPATQHPGA
ncbi:hypothetical protein HDG41_007491 [Paraburkholderia sp. JPY162]|uniref:Uncharacterized protein n=1 Tax=Paraburkholderia youngii TaxID=2782701 RepID=A0A7W8LE92_9BURK|nr:hypothetical protein [Paraburkholderia youngii]